jgi:uncharacterized protein (UPF0332 family)
MMEDRKIAAIKLKLTKANLRLQEVPVHIHLKYHSTAINRMYYACLEATRVLLLTKDAIVKTHKGVLAKLHELFVKTGELDNSSADYFSMLMQQRIVIDYGEELPAEREDIDEYYKSAKQYIEKIVSIIKL